MKELTADDGVWTVASWGATLTIVGVLGSGPLAQLLVFAVQPQPAWEAAATFAAGFHRVQTVPFFFGFLLLSGSVAMVAAIHLLAERKARPLLALVSVSIGAGVVFLNYLVQASFVPALAEHYAPELDPVIVTWTMANPRSLAWALEMWGYAVLGLGTWLAASIFRPDGLEGVARWLFIINGVLSLVGAFVTAYDLGWVLSMNGLVAYVAWNVLYLALAVVFLLVIRRRRTEVRARR